jgi:hypothetical protein
VRHIKSRKLPEKNIMNRYMLERAVLLQQVRSTGQVYPCDPDDSDGVAPSCTNSSTLSNAVHWPQLTRNNHKVVHGSLYKRHNRCSGNCCARAVEMYIGHERFEALRKGKERTDRVRDLKALETDSVKVRVGAWFYATQPREVRRKIRASCESWFAIRASDVPDWRDKCALMSMENPDWDAQAAALDGVFYGCIRKFIRLTGVRGLSDNEVSEIAEFSLAQCDIYRPESVDPITKLATIATDDDMRKLEDVYIDLTKIICPIARGPKYEGWQAKRAQQNLTLARGKWVVMLVHK